MFIKKYKSKMKNIIKRIIIKSVSFKVIVLMQYIITFLKLRLKYYTKHIYRKLFRQGTKYPSTIQLPITFKCNFDCVMCGMKSLIHKPNFSSSELDLILQSKLFSKVTSVGVNGGEPFLVQDIIEYIEVIIKRCPKLKDIFIISNGYFDKEILKKAPEIKKACNARGVKFHFVLYKCRCY